MANKLSIKTFACKEIPMQEDGKSIDLDAVGITGWHEEVFDAKTNGWPERGRYSNTPRLGCGNNFHEDDENLYAMIGEAVMEYAKAPEKDEDDTCVFWWWNEPTEEWIFLEIGFDMAD
ncbi:hypothetical protein RCDURKIN_131 [Rhodobacter phage RcDurkin]|nr:hypothetical protein RCDURKIN_131 [Rhodobacter phage RcDurkin]